MTEPTIICPQCRVEIKLTESLAAPLLEATRREYDQRFTKMEAAIAQREAAVTAAQRALDEQVAAKLKTARAAIAEEEARKARLALGTDLEQKTRDLAELQEILRQRDAKLAEAQRAQADLIRKQRELDDARREMELTIERRVQETLGAARDQARREAEEQTKLRLAESQQTIAQMQRQIEDLKRRAEQGSQQLQGEVQELALEALLRERFPRDVIDPVPKGEHGGDALHRVHGPLGQPCGTILWESKRTKNWSDGWLAKLRGDQRAAKAEIAVLATQALPRGVDTFDCIDGIWVTALRCVVPVALVLRQSLIDVAAARTAGEGQQTKMEMVYEYLTGPRFRHRVQAIVEKFTDMQADLERERKTMTKLWAKREAQIRGVVESTAGMYGDLQGIAGRTLQEIEGLEMRLLGGGD
ncbi:MAG: DUF2130 domain-containing protein [Candidatus Sumerlaeia bacterium]|nr:DUF2130 domain-containing protein [Candidatus Sumerlaeia bacterium]